MYLQESPLSFSHGLYGRSDLEDLNEVARRVLEKSKKVAKFDSHLALQVRSSRKTGKSETCFCGEAARS